MRLGLIVEYEGTSYSGFQYQMNAASVQEEIETAIKKLTGEDIRLQAAGRTDAGVHAKGQVVAFNTTSNYKPEVFADGLNFYLPFDIAIKSAYITKDSFNPRRHALSRLYRYTVLQRPTRLPLQRNTTHHIRSQLDLNQMSEAMSLFVGLHDFSQFSGTTADPCASTQRYIYEASVQKSGDILEFDIMGNAFLPHQVRRMVGAIVAIGRKSLSLKKYRIMLEGGMSGMVAHSLPSKGLCLMSVAYRDFPPEIGEEND